MKTRGLLLAALALALSACGGSPARSAAERGDYRALSTELQRLHKAGKLSNEDARKIGLAVASHELGAAKGDDVVARLRDLRACAVDLDDAFKERSKVHDAAGAEAALARYEDGQLSASAARDLWRDPDDAWRAIGARTLHGEHDGDARRKAMLDPSPRVRRGAMMASARARDLADVDVLAESARLDPEPMVRTDAVRALAELAGKRGPNAKPTVLAESIAVRFRDLWTTGDDAVREDIAAAWAISPLFEMGGREALRVLLGQGRGPGVIAGAGAITRRTPSGAPVDRELERAATGVLATTIREGSRRDRLHAIAIAPLWPDVLEAVRAASKDDDALVRVPALAKLLASKSDRDAALKELEAVAGKKDDAELAARARLHLAAAGDLRVQAWIEQDLASPEVHVRLGAADALAALGRSARAAPLLTDPDAHVRTRVACVLIAGGR
ncbi:MAG: hypothetical protein JNL38_38635 [Myxococcales bacterium]|nr:hypothetical protein [Myxococcales bacterium]